MSSAIREHSAGLKANNRSIKFPKAEQSIIFDRQLFGHLSRLMNGTLVQWNFVGA
jgi:hypothetical protein